MRKKTTTSIWLRGLQKFTMIIPLFFPFFILLFFFFFPTMYGTVKQIKLWWLRRCICTNVERFIYLFIFWSPVIIGASLVGYRIHFEATTSWESIILKKIRAKKTFSIEQLFHLIMRYLTVSHNRWYFFLERTILWPEYQNQNQKLKLAVTKSSRNEKSVPEYSF